MARGPFPAAFAFSSSSFFCSSFCFCLNALSSSSISLACFLGCLQGLLLATFAARHGACRPFPRPCHPNPTKLLHLKLRWDFPVGPVVKNLPRNSGDVGSIPGPGTKIPHASEQLSLCTTTESVYSNKKIPHAATKTRCSQIKKKKMVKMVLLHYVYFTTFICYNLEGRYLWNSQNTVWYTVSHFTSIYKSKHKTDNLWAWATCKAWAFTVTETWGKGSSKVLGHRLPNFLSSRGPQHFSNFAKCPEAKRKYHLVSN